MNTEEQTAKEMIEKFRGCAYVEWHGGGDEMTNEEAAKECADICCQYIIDAVTEPLLIEFWEEVKKSING